LAASCENDMIFLTLYCFGARSAKSCHLSLLVRDM